MGELLDWLTFMSDLFEDRQPRKMRGTPGLMLLQEQTDRAVMVKASPEGLIP